MRRVLILVVLTGLLAACGPKLEFAPAAPLVASAADLAAIPNLEPGPYAVIHTPAQDWEIDDQTLRVRIVRPDGEGPFPLVLFSHGFAANVDGYDNLLNHWASHGYISISPYHRDGGGSMRAIFNSLRLGNEKLIAARVADIRLILEHLDALDQIAPGLAATIDASKIIAAGHSFGAFTAQQFGGAASVDPGTGNRIEGRDKRVQAVVAISPPGEMFGLINAQSWKTMAVPMLITTGTWDADGHFVTQWQQHKLSWENAPAGDNWLLIVQGADHYLGNLICRPERDQPPQQDALRMVNATTVSFMNSMLLNEPHSRSRLNSDRLARLTAGFATLTRR